MFLSEILAALANNTNVNITLMDDQDTQVVTFNAGGYGAIESDLGSRTVKRIKINSGTSISISMEAANSTGDPSTDPTEPTDPDPTEPNSDPSGNP